MDVTTGSMDVVERHQDEEMDRELEQPQWKEASREHEEMDSKLWSRLPEDLLVHVLSRVPLDSIARHQQVCRAWRRLSLSSSFTQCRTGPTSPNSWFIFQQKVHPFSSSMTIDCYNTHSNKWHELRFGHLPQVQRVMATAGSLVLCLGKIHITRDSSNGIPGRTPPPSYIYRDIIVCNPLRPNSLERIPDRARSSVPQIGMVADPHSGNYRVVFASSEKTELYDSCSKSWRTFEHNLSPVLDTWLSPVEYRGKLLFLGSGELGQGKVFVYNLDDYSCSSFDNLFARADFPRFGYLDRCGGRLLMVRVTSSPVALSRSRSLNSRREFRFERNFYLRVAEYWHEGDDDLSRGEWREVTFIALSELEKVVDVNTREGGKFLGVASAAGRDDLMCFTMGMKDGKLDWANCSAGRAVFLYSFSQNSWCFVGERPDWVHDGVICMRSLQFQPSLLACLDTVSIS